MDLIRPFHSDDIPSVAKLFQKIFRHTNAPAPASLTSYFADIYLNNPWRHDAINSLVVEQDGIISGFLGAIPFPMRINDIPIRAVIGGNYMIDPDHPNPLAGVKILKKLMSGPQDVTYSDTATATARKIWEGLNSKSFQLYSMQWLKILRPAQFAVSMVTRKTVLSPLATLAKPISFVTDRTLTAIPKSPFRLKKSNLYSEELSVDQLLDAIRRNSSRCELKPEYTERSLAWLINKAEEKKEYGPLRKIALFAPQKKMIGWYLYYPNANNLGHVLQIGAEKQTIDAVLSHLFIDAQHHGSLALAGRIEPRFIQEFSTQNCIYMHRNSSLVVHTKNDLITNALYRGDAFFTRLEGEWWTRLQGDTFTE
ncbi:MAG: hypothetical protein Q8L88_06040 [Bacteroidota bacterium]|nr:hypothetical protein [Bacteroidota bacterium]